MADSVIEVTDATFESEVLKSDLPVMVDMWAPWCGPCRMVSPTIEALGEQNAGAIKACKLNVDDNPESAGKYSINAIPTVLFFQEGKEVDSLRLIGVQPKAVYQKAIDQLAK